MPDSKQLTDRQDGRRIDVDKDDELRDWPQTLGLAPEKLRAAVEAMGDQLNKVEAHSKPSARR
jgi:hypothetical protein